MSAVGPRELVAALSAAAAVAVLRGPPPERRVARARGPAARAGPLGPVRVPQRLVRVVAGRPNAAPTVRALLEAWSRELQAGRVCGDALRDATVDVPAAAELVPRTCAALELGAGVGPAIAQDARGAPDDLARRALLSMSACWNVGEQHGGRLAAALDRVANGVRAEEQHLAHVRAELAGARASARLLAALPLFALLLASGLGMNPVRVLVCDPLGRAALVGGLALDVVGLWWTDRVVRAAERAA